jgi:hypothetical protein
MKYRRAAPPTRNPTLVNFQHNYDFHDIVNVTCKSPPSKPIPTLSWYINGVPAPQEYLALSSGRDELNLNFILDVQHLQNGSPRVSLQCKASLAYNSSNFETVRADHISIDRNHSFSSTALFISGLKRKYNVGDTIRLTCAYTGREDDVRMEWRVNDARINPKFVVQYRLKNYIGLNMFLTPRHLNSLNQVSVKCVAAKTFAQERFKSASSAKERLFTSIYLHLSLTLMFGIITKS